MTASSHDRFFEAQDRVITESEHSGGIGTLSEKSLHKILKYYVEPDSAYHEIEISGSVADIKNGQGIVEIQTRALERLVPKLKKFLPEYPVTVVYPVITEKTLVWLDGESGEVSEVRKSPKHAYPTDILYELLQLTPYFGDGRLTVRLLLLSATDYKSLDGYGKDRKKHATRIDRLPTALLGELTIATRRDVAALLSDKLPTEFTAADLDRITHLRGRRAYAALKCLLSLGLAERIGNRGRAYLYSFDPTAE